MSRMLLLAALACLALTARAISAADNELSAEEREAGFVLLFNGQDFSGWRFTDGADPKTSPPVNWKVEGGCLKVLGGGKPHLASEKEYGDFELRLEWRAVKEKYNSGLFVRSRKGLGSNQLNLAKGSEGAFIGGKLAGAKSAASLQKPAGEWNEWRVRAEGDKLTFWCNGQMAWEGSGLADASGYIGLQAEGAAIDFRNLRLRELKK